MKVWEHLAGADVDRRGRGPGSEGLAGDAAAGPRPGEGLHHHRGHAREGGQARQGVLEQDQLLNNHH